MSEDAVAYVSIIPESSGVASEIGRQFDGASVGQKMSASVSKGFLSTVGGIGLGLVKIVGGAVAISGGLIAGLALKGGISRALNIQDAEAKLTGLGHSAADVTGIMADALASVKGTAYGLDTAATVAAASVAAGIKPGKDLTQYLKNVADAATIAGVSMDSMGNIFNTVQAGNKAYNQQLEQLSQQGIPIYQFLAKELHTTAGAVFDLASSGEISSAEFGKAIQDNIGGAALASGKTARGAWANVEASLSRLGAAFTGPLIAAAPGLFVAIEGAVDRADAALQPYIAKLDGFLVPAIKSLATWISKLDFNNIAAGFANFFKSVKSGVTTAASAVGKFAASIKDGVGGAASAVGDANLGGVFGTIWTAIKPMLPIFVDIAKGIGAIAGAVGTLIAAGIGVLPPIIKVFAGALGWLKDNAQLIAPLIIAIVGAMLLYKASQIASNIASLAMIPAYSARTAVLLASIPATAAATGSTSLLNAVVEEQRVGLIRAAVAWVAQKAVLVAGAVATGIAAAAMGVATAAQWLWNAAMDANPIMLVVLAIAALVAGLVWFFTQTKLGQAIWAGFVGFLTAAWSTLSAIGIAVFNALGSFVIGVWNGIKAAALSVWTWIVTAVTNYIHLVLAVVTTVMGTVRTVWSSAWSSIGSFFGGIWAGILRVVGTIGSAFSRAFGGLGKIVRGAFSGVVGFVRGVINSIIGIVNGAIGGINDIARGVRDITGGAINVHLSKIPHLADGAIVSAPTVAMVGEGRYPEAVVPLSPKNVAELGGSNDRPTKIEMVWNGIDFSKFLSVFVDGKLQTVTRQASNGWGLT